MIDDDLLAIKGHRPLTYHIIIHIAIGKKETMFTDRRVAGARRDVLCSPGTDRRRSTTERDPGGRRQRVTGV